MVNLYICIHRGSKNALLLIHDCSFYKWSLKFCTPEVLYYIDGNALPVVAFCRDLGVMLASDLSPSIHIWEIVRKAHQRANAILRCFVTRDKELLVRTFTTYVRPLLEYNSLIWSPHVKKDIEAIEKVQRRFTRRLSGINTLSYSQRLKLLNLPSLELRRLHIDLFFCPIVYLKTTRTNLTKFSVRGLWS